MADYDITEAFRKIENELIASMMRNMDRHRAEETKEGLLWTQWQTEQLKSLERYKIENAQKYQKEFKDINNRIEGLIRTARDTGNMEQEIEILNAIKDGFKGEREASSAMKGQFFQLNDHKLESLINATTNDMQRAQTAILRMSNDQYRKAIFNAQVYANTGAGTYEKAVDMATKEMLSSGLNCIEYVNGARHTLPDYADMAIRTASKRAYLQGEGEKRKERGISTVIINKRGNPCPKCLPWVGKVLIDDVWSGGSKEDSRYPLMSYAISRGLYHPRCKDSHSTYFPGISTADDTWTQEELEAVELANKEEARQQHAIRQAEKFERLSKYSLDPDNKRTYAARTKKWEEEADKHLVLDASRNTGRPVDFNEKYDYNIHLDGYSDEVNNGLSKASKEVARLGGTDKCEHMFLVNLDTGGLDYYETNGLPNEVGYDFWKHIKKNPDKRYAFVHNHNTDGILSETDMLTLLTNYEIPAMVAVRNDAVKYVAERKGDILNDLFDDLYKEQIDVLNKALKDGKITIAERSRRKELLIVENLLRDYTKGGKLIEYDGRK